MELYIGSPSEKISVLQDLARYAHLARDKNLVNKAMDKLRQLAEDTKVKLLWRYYEILERRFTHWSTELSSGNAPEEREIVTISSRMLNAEINAEMPEVD